MNKLLENNIIRLRDPEPEDLDVLYAWENDTALWEKGASVVPYSRYSIKQYLIDYKHDLFVDRQIRLMVTLRATSECIGTVDLYDFDPLHRRAGVGILIERNLRRKGYAAQALMLLEEYAFDIFKMQQLYAIIPENNIPSRGLFAKAGYRQTGVLEDWISKKEGFAHAVMMQKLNRFPQND